MMESMCMPMENNGSIYIFIMEYFHCCILLKGCQAAFLNLSEGLAKFKIHIGLTKKNGTVYYLFILPFWYEEHSSNFDAVLHMEIG